MPDDEALDNLSRTEPQPSWQHQGEDPEGLRGENTILELISTEVPLPYILNRLCAAIDLQIGNVVSTILLPDDSEHDLQTIARSALHYGLHVFWSATIPLREEPPLGHFEMYCCDPRTPSPCELKLIQRVTDLAELAIRRPTGNPEFERSYFHRKTFPRKILMHGAQWN